MGSKGFKGLDHPRLAQHSYYNMILVFNIFFNLIFHIKHSIHIRPHKVAMVANFSPDSIFGYEAELTDVDPIIELAIVQNYMVE